MEKFIKYLKRVLFFVLFIFISIFIYFWNTSDYEYASPGDDPEYVERVIYEMDGYDIISYGCYEIFDPTVVIEDNYFIYVPDAIYESPGVMNKPESQGIVYKIDDKEKEDFFNQAKYITNCNFDYSKNDFITLSNFFTSILTPITGTQNSSDILKTIYYCTDKWDRGIFGNPDFEYRQFSYGSDKKIYRCEV
jgi:hypothetical protein